MVQVESENNVSTQRPVLEQVWSNIEALGFTRDEFQIDRMAHSPHPVSLRAQTICRISHLPSGFKSEFGKYRAFEDNYLVALEMMFVQLSSTKWVES